LRISKYVKYPPKCAFSRLNIQKKIWGGGTAPSNHWEGTPSHRPTPSGASTYAPLVTQKSVYKPDVVDNVATRLCGVLANM